MTDIKLGELSESYWDKQIIGDINRHVADIDRLMIQELRKNNGYYTHKYQDIIKKRGFTYDEYLSLFHPPTSTLNYHKFPVYQVLGISSDQKRRSYTLRFTNDENGYMDLLRTIPAIRALLEKRKLAARIPYKRMWEHLYMNGASGSGKSTLMKRIIFTLATRSNGIVLIDPQGKLASEVRAFEHLDRDRIVYFKPRLKTGYTPTINFLDKDRGKDTNSMALRLARVISIISQGELSNPMVSLLRPCLAGLIENEGYSLSDLKRFLIKEENDDLVQLGLSHPDPEYQSTFQRINSGYYNKTRDAIISKLDVVLQDKYFRNP